MASSMIGSRVERTEDKKFITGKGRYTADITLHGQTYAFFIRSPHARAKIKKVDTKPLLNLLSLEQLEKMIKDTKRQMNKMAKHLNFIEAARLRDELKELEKNLQQKK